MPEGSLPCSQQAATGPYPEPHAASPVRLILVLYSHTRLVLLLKVLFPLGFPTQILYGFLISFVN